MASYNKIIIIGNLVRDPELKVTQNGTQVCQITVASTHKYKEQEETCFIDAACFGTTAEVVSKYFSKGKPILIEGRLKLDKWQDRETGQNRSKHSIFIEKFEFIGSKQDNEQQNNQHNSGYDSYSQSQPARDAHPNPDPDDDVPF